MLRYNLVMINFIRDIDIDSHALRTHGVCSTSGKEVPANFFSFRISKIFLPIWGTCHTMRDAVPQPCCAASGRLKNHPLPLRLCLAVYKSTIIHMVQEGLRCNLYAAKQALTGVNNCRDAAWFYATICRSFVLRANYSVSVVKQADATHIELNYLSVPPPSLQLAYIKETKQIPFTQIQHHCIRL